MTSAAQYTVDEMSPLAFGVNVIFTFKVRAHHRSVLHYFIKDFQQQQYTAIPAITPGIRIYEKKNEIVIKFYLKT